MTLKKSEYVFVRSMYLPNDDLEKVGIFRRNIRDKSFIIDCAVCFIKCCIDTRTVTVYNGSGLTMHGHMRTTKFWKCIELYTERKTKLW